MKLREKVAIITGGGRGIGREYALRFSEEGANIVIADISFENAQKAAGDIEAKGGKALAVHTDVSSPPSMLEMAQKALARFGRIDILLNNAAFITASG